MPLDEYQGILSKGTSKRKGRVNRETQEIIKVNIYFRSAAVLGCAAYKIAATHFIHHQ